MKKESKSYSAGKNETKIKIISCFVLVFVFYYGVVFNPKFLVGFMKACLYIGTLLAAKEIFVYLVIQKRSPRELAKELGMGAFLYVFSLLLILVYFAAMVYFIAF